MIGEIAIDNLNDLATKSRLGKLTASMYYYIQVVGSISYFKTN